MARNEASERQIEAARPDRSTWLSANAGSGKTRVLTDRVARLLLEGVEPQHILCLTYTKAAASEMQNRLFRRLGDWAMLEDAGLRRHLSDLGIDSAIGADTLRQARTLFARAIEAPGGLKIQTIHSFCAALLRRFPLEAGVSPQFSEIEDRAAALLRNEVVQSMASGPQARLVQRLADHLSDADFTTITAQIVRHKAAFGSTQEAPDIRALFDLAPDITPALLPRLPFDGSEQRLFRAVLPVLASQTQTSVKIGEILGSIDLTNPSDADYQSLCEAFLYKDRGETKPEAKTKSIPPKKAGEAMGPHLDPFHAFMERVAAARDKELALAAYEKTAALHDFARAFLPAYEGRKQRRGWLDFDDLILKARDLLTDEAVASWVLYRLDGGIDHILVDEAQDTSPVQWSVIERLAQEFTSGKGARADVARTIFVVGDKKQSIYSFQGADPREFDRMQAEFAERLANTGTPLQEAILQYSFRSSHVILDLVDRCFEGRESAGFTADQNHRAFKSALPGRVDVWPVVPVSEPVAAGPWFDPVDQPGQNHHTVILGEKIAGEMQRMIAGKVTIPAEIGHSGQYVSRPVEPGDFLILVQRRSPLFHEIIRACKALDLPIAGADRLKVGAEMAVKDLAALLSFLAMPDDDLSLAVALKSPLFGWNEAQLYDLAHKRSEARLWPALRDRVAEFPETLFILNDLLHRVDFLRPYDLIERILTRHDGRRRLLGRLGAEAEDGIDALLSQALGYERTEVPSLTGFLIWMETDDLTIKRQMGSSGNRIRVMTVHGSKGLESPIVILPDTARPDTTVKDDLLPSGETVLWSMPAARSPFAVRNARADRAATQEAERDRLLYVAMTRAEKWLIVAASGELGSSGESWHDRISAGMTVLEAQPQAFPTGEGRRLQSPDWGETETVFTPEDPETPTDIPSFFARPAPVAPPALATLSPSDLGGAKALAGEAGLDEETAKRRGRQIHRLLEFLPTAAIEDWPDVAARLLSYGPDAAEGENLRDLLAEASQALRAEALRPIFHPDALTEVSLSAALPELDGARIHGTVDRLIIGEESILVVDFKSNRIVPDTAANCPDGLLRQMGAYTAALSRIYPQHRIDTAILWTRTATFMPLPHDLVVAALRGGRYLDAPLPRP